MFGNYFLCEHGDIVKVKDRVLDYEDDFGEGMLFGVEARHKPL